MRKARLMIAALVLGILFFGVGSAELCAQSNSKNAIVGSWTEGPGGGRTWIFNADGSGFWVPSGARPPVPSSERPPDFIFGISMNTDRLFITRLNSNDAPDRYDFFFSPDGEILLLFTANNYQRTILGKNS